MKESKFVPYQKLSKKAQKALNQKKRSGWGEISPAMRVEENPKAYKRHGRHRNKERELDYYA